MQGACILACHLAYHREEGCACKPASEPKGRAQVTEGSGRLLVLAVGERSEWGRTMAMVASEPAPTPLQAALGTLAAAIGKVGLVVGALCFVVLLVRRAPAAPAFSPCGARDRP